ncbi:MAG: hypothetical protein LBJ08_06180, partial [Bifidobacteriaceae bacterium]|nr:hypothetical protein [Bifidobacteriaceae bacterium]
MNPYNFVSTPDRMPPPGDGGMGDRRAPSQAVADGYTAVIPIRLIARTPLLFPDQSRAKDRLVP